MYKVSLKLSNKKKKRKKKGKKEYSSSFVNKSPPCVALLRKKFKNKYVGNKIQYRNEESLLFSQ